jgi:hypothetical protein
MTPSGVSSPTDTAEGPQDIGSGGTRCGGDSGGGTVEISGGICGGRGGGGDCDEKPESVPAASVGGSSSKRVVLDLPPPR